MTSKFRYLLLVFMLCSATVFGQLHAHNDYEKPFPFTTAYNSGCGSIEVDVFLEKGQLLVAHEVSQFDKTRTISSLYLNPLDSVIASGKSRRLQLLIDLKTEAVSTLDALINVLKQYPSITESDSISLVISGNRPSPEEFKNYPSYILFDGLPEITYSSEALKRIPMFSSNFKKYSDWRGKGKLPADDRQRIDSVIKKVHGLGKTMRFWNAPDNPDAWKELMRLNVDWINTDQPEESSAFVRKFKHSG